MRWEIEMSHSRIGGSLPSPFREWSGPFVGSLVSPFVPEHWRRKCDTNGANNVAKGPTSGPFSLYRDSLKNRNFFLVLPLGPATLQEPI